MNSAPPGYSSANLGAAGLDNTVSDHTDSFSSPYFPSYFSLILPEWHCSSSTVTIIDHPVATRHPKEVHRVHTYLTYALYGMVSLHSVQLKQYV